MADSHASRHSLLRESAGADPSARLHDPCHDVANNFRRNVARNLVLGWKASPSACDEEMVQRRIASDCDITPRAERGFPIVT
jgi:hypothetical protein